MRYFVAPNGTGTSTNHWNTGVIPGDLAMTVSQILANPSPTGDEIWAVGDNNVLGAQYQGVYNLGGSPLVINQNTAPLSIYGGCAGWETYLCQRNANIVCNDATIPDFFLHPSILDGGGTNRVIEMLQTNTCRIDGFVVRNGNAATIGNGGGIDVSQSNNILFENMVVMNNQTAGEAGGINIENTENVHIRNSIFFNNSAIAGGLFLNDCKDAALVNVLFIANYSRDGDGTVNGLQRLVINTLFG